MISIIIVQYHVKKELFDCIQSIIDSRPKVNYQIIVVDNDEVKTIEKDLLKEFPKVIYISNENKGFGQGNNTGAKYAKGNYLFFLNPDTIVYKNTIDVLYQFLKKNKSAGVVAPFLLHENKKPFEQQGVKELNPFRAIFSISIINKMFPNNPVAKNYFIQWNKIETKEVDVVPGTAFMLSSELYASVKGFDEKFFLYFEEFDLCKRIKEKGYKLFIEPKAKITHLWERSTKQRNDINKIFNESRLYYFKKHFGLLTAIITDAFLNFGKYSFIELLILFLAAFLLFFKLNILMPFIGDQGWFYLSARDMLLTGHIPLVGITSSHTWLHQGPLWTYLLAIALYMGHFNPISGAYFTATTGLFTVWLVYKLGSEIFSSKIGLFSSLFYATSPLIILNARMPYHTSLIPLFTLVWFYLLYKWINGFKYGFPLLLFILTVLYNLELSMVMLLPILFIIIVYGFIKKKKWAQQLCQFKIFLFSLLGIIIPMIPMIFYDIHHGYPQTLKFGIWILYKIANAVGVPLAHPDIPGETLYSMFNFASSRIAELLFFPNTAIAWIILLISTLNLIIYNFISFRKKRFFNSYLLLLLFFLIPFLFYLAERTNSDAYWPIFFIVIAFMFGILFDRLLLVKKLFYVTITILVLIVGINLLTFFHSEYMTGKNIITFSDRLSAAKQIVRNSQGKEYNLIGTGPSSKYESFTMGYLYLTWWLGHAPSKNYQKFHIFITEKGSHIILTNNMQRN